MTIQHPSEVGCDAEAAKGMTKLLLFCLCGDVKFSNGTITNVTYAMPSQGMAIVMSNPCSARPQQFADLLRSSLATAKKNNPNDIRSRELSMTHTSKSMAGHLIIGNLVLDSVTSLYNEAQSIDPTAFLPQRDQAKIASERATNLSIRIEDNFDVLESHRKKTATTITRIGSLTSVRDVTSLCININTVILAITSSDSPQPIIYQLLTKMIELTVSSDYGDWFDQCSSAMTNLHLKLFSYIDMIWVNIARGASEFRNVKVVTKQQPIAAIDMSFYTKAVAVAKALVTEFTIAQSQGAPIVVPDSITSKYCPKHPKVNVTSVATPAAAAANRGVTFKQDNITLDTGTPKDPDQPPKRSCRGSPSDRPAINKKDLGIFYLNDSDMAPAKVFPKDLSARICVDYTCKGCECTAATCSFAHPRNAKDIDQSNREKIVSFFKNGKHGWLSGFHFRNKLPDLSDTSKSMMGGAGGIGSKD